MPRLPSSRWGAHLVSACGWFVLATNSACFFGNPAPSPAEPYYPSPSPSVIVAPTPAPTATPAPWPSGLQHVAPQVGVTYVYAVHGASYDHLRITVKALAGSGGTISMVSSPVVPEVTAGDVPATKFNGAYWWFLNGPKPAFQDLAGGHAEKLALGFGTYDTVAIDEGATRTWFVEGVPVKRAGGNALAFELEGIEPGATGAATPSGV